MRELDMEKMLRAIDEGKGPKQASEAKPFYDKFVKPEPTGHEPDPMMMDKMDKSKAMPKKMPMMKSHMPVGARMRGAWGDVGSLRGREARAAGGFKSGMTMSTAPYFKKGR
jgi:hypothetical protein